MTEYGNVIHQTFGGEAAQARVIANQLDPEKAQRAVELGEATGIEAEVVSQNLDEFDQYHKASLGAQIVRNNPALKQYIDKHPMAAAVSGDDLGQLDLISERAKALAEDDDPMAKMHKIFWEGFGEGGIGAWVMNNPKNFNEDGTLKTPYLAAIASGVGAFIEIPMRAFGGALAVGEAAIAGVYTDITGDESGGRRLGRELPQLFESYMGTHMGRTLNATKFNKGIQAEIQKVTQDQRAQMYWQSGKPLPIGLSKEFDAAIERISKEYWKKIDDLTSEADKSTTKERNPEFFRSFIEQHPELEGAEVRVDAVAVRRLYGEDIPTPNDGLLGFIPNLEITMRVGEDLGIAVRIPLVDWVTKVDKDLRDVLKDDARAKLQSVSKKEAEELKVWAQVKEEPKPIEGEAKPTEPLSHEEEAIRSVRQSSGLEPQEDVLATIKEDRKYAAEKLKLARLDEKARQDLDINMGSKDAFDITDEKGNVVGTFQGQLNGTEYFVDWISSRGWAQSFGNKQLMQLIRELKAEYPGIKTIVGDRVTGARTGTEKQGERVTFKAEIADDGTINISEKRGRSQIKPMLSPEEGVMHTFAKNAEGEALEGLVKPKKFWTENEKRIRDTVSRVMEKLAPEGQKWGVVHEIEGGGRKMGGAFIDFDRTESIILVALGTKDPVATAAHEVGHALKRSGVFSEAEWATLTERALKGDGDKGTWLDQYNIQRRYGDRDKATQIEEAIVHKFGDYVSGKWKPEAGPIQELFERLKEIVTQIRLGLKEAFGRELSAEDIFEKARTGGYKGRRPLTTKAEYIFRPDDVMAEIKAQREEQLELPGVTRIEDQQVFEKAAAAGMTVKQYRQYMKAIKAVRESDLKYQEEKALAYEKKKQTKEWKQEAEALEPKVQDELNALPDYRANEFFRTGVLDGEKLSKLPKLNPEFIDPELVRGLPERYLSEKGMHPDDVAGLLGIDSGSSLVEMLATWKEAQGDVPAAKFVNDLVKGEVERRMSMKHGPLSENIIDAALDHVINNAQYELIHQEVLAAALRAGKTELPISKKEMEEYAKDQFRRAPVGNVSTEEILREMGKSQRAAAMALLDGDPVAALKHEQQRMMAFIAAREAKKLEVQQRIFDRNVKRFSEREVAGFPQEYTNFIHDIMIKLGAGKLNFTFEDFQKRLGVTSHRSLEEFTTYKIQNDGLVIKTDPRLFDDTLYGSKPPLDNLTVQQFMDAHDFIKSMIKNGRDETKVFKEGEAREKAEIKKAMLDELSTFDPVEFVDAEGGRKMFKIIPPKIASPIRHAIASFWQMESIFNRIDRGNPFGPFSQYAMRPLIEGANYVPKLEKKYSKRLEELKDKTNLKEKIPNNLFIEPTTIEQEPGQQRFMPITRDNLRKIILYWGSETGRQKLSEGYNIEPKRIQDWIDRHAKEEDFIWAEKYGKIWRELKDEIDVMYTNIAGAPPEDIRLSKVITNFGDFDGWYHPLMPHPNFDMSTVGGAPTYAKGLIGENHFSAFTANGHTMRRTGAIYPLDLGLDSSASVMKRQIYDLAMRPGLIESMKFLRDHDVRMAMTRYFGKEITDLIDPYLQDVANVMNNNDAGSHVLLKLWGEFRQNVIGNLIGFNPGTVLKHAPTALVQSIAEVGQVEFAQATRSLFSINEKTSQRNWDFAMETSEELARRHQHYFETLKGQNASMLGRKSIREKVLSVGAWPVAITDLTSAVPLWLAQYNKSMREGISSGDAIYMADRSVRRAHGSTAVTNRPRVMRSEMMSLMNPVYGFFNHILNRKYEMAWRAKDQIQGFTGGEITPKEFLRFAPAMGVMIGAYIVAPAIFEELASPLPSKPDESFGEKAAKSLLYSQGSDWLVIRDVAHFAIAGFDPSIGILGPVGQGIRDVVNDMSHPNKSLQPENAGRTIKHAFSAAGMATGMTNQQMGRWAQLAWDYSIDKDVPENYWQWLTALRFGQTKGHPKTAEEYVEHIAGAH